MSLKLTFPIFSNHIWMFKPSTLSSETIIEKKKPTDKNINSNIIFGTQLALIEKQLQKPADQSDAEWMVNCICDFIEQIQQFNQFCQEDCKGNPTCKQMCNGRFFYKWQDSTETARELCANEYISNITSWAPMVLTDEKVLTEAGQDGPDFFPVCKRVCKRILRGFAHFYIHHIGYLKAAEQNQNLVKEIKKLVLFIQIYNLLDDETLSSIEPYIKEWL